MAYPEKTVLRVQQRVARAMHWARTTDWPSELPPIEVFNEIGEWLTNVHQWNHLDRPIVSLGLARNVGWLTPPDDFAELISLRPSTAGRYSIRAGSSAEVLDARTNLPQTGVAFVYNVVGSPSSLEGPRSRSIIQLGPVPGATVKDAFSLSYRAGWLAVENSGDHIALPSFLDPVFLRACVLYMRGYEKDAETNLEDVLDGLFESTLMQGAIDRDDRIQTDLGVVLNTAEDAVTGGSGVQTFVSNQDGIEIVT